MKNAIPILSLFAIGIAAAQDPGLESGIQAGGKISAYQTTKVGGVDDGVAVGKSLCYT